MGASVSNRARDGRTLSGLNPSVAIKGLNLQADNSAPAAAQSHHALIKSLAVLLGPKIARALVSADRHTGIRR